MTTSMEPTTPPGRFSSTARTASSPSKPLNTSEKNEAPSRIMNTMLLTRVVVRMTSRRRPQPSCLRCNAISVAPVAPTAAASVGVASPARIDPSTARISSNGGNSTRTTWRNRLLPRIALRSLAEIAGMACGRKKATSISQNRYKPTSIRPGNRAPANRSPTETVFGENIPCASWACWYDDDNTSPSMTRMIEGGMI